MKDAMKNSHSHLIISCMLLFSFSGVNDSFAMNSDPIITSTEVIEEAEALPEEQPTPPSTPRQESPHLNQSRTRAYFLIDGMQSTGSTDNKIYFPNAQLSFSSDFQLQGQNFFLFDAIGNYDQKDKSSNAFVNQMGFRSHWSEKLQYFIGKERNRRSPGLIVSPSDFIYSNTNLPGQREDRKGVWLARTSYQQINFSLDLIILPVQNETVAGLPDSQQDSTGAALRALKQWDIFDISIMAGRHLGVNRVGVSGQTLWDNKYKMYVELGTAAEVNLYNNRKKSNPIQTLLGISFEESKDFTTRLEYYHNGQGLNAEEFSQMQQYLKLAPPLVTNKNKQKNSFLRQHYLIASLTFPELDEKYNLTFSAIKSLEDDSIIGSSRFEYIVTDKILTGISFKHLQGGADSQLQYREFNTQTTVDLKYSF